MLVLSRALKQEILHDAKVINFKEVFLCISYQAHVDGARDGGGKLGGLEAEGLKAAAGVGLLECWIHFSHSCERYI